MDGLFRLVLLAMIVSPFVLILGGVILVLGLFVNSIKNNPKLIKAAKLMLVWGALVVLVSWGGCFVLLT